MNLQEAIEALSLHAASRLRLCDWEQEIRLVIDAARAFSCEECRGTGRICIAVADTTIDCRKCKAARNNAKGKK